MEQTKVVYNYNTRGALIGSMTLNASDLCPITGVFLIPGMATDMAPPETCAEGHELIFNGTSWVATPLRTTNEKKLAGELPLEEGDVLEDGKIVSYSKPSDEHIWNGDKWLSKDDRKVKGDLPLDDGEIIKDGAIVKFERPDRAHKWTGTEWVFDQGLFNIEKFDAYDRMKAQRELAFETGFMFEGKYLIKTRTQDLTDANAVYTQFTSGVIITTKWRYSNRISEVIDAQRFFEIFKALGAFRSEQFSKEGMYVDKIDASKTIAELDAVVWY